MKYAVYIFAALALLLVSCINKERESKLDVQSDSIALALSSRDSIINEVFASLNDITANLNLIKQRENIVTAYVENIELRREPTSQVKEDIMAIDELLIDNRKTISKLESSIAILKKSHVDISSLENLMSELKIQLDTRNSEVTVLMAEVEAANLKVSELTTQINGLSSDNLKLEESAKNASDILNSAYYIVGSQSELLDNGIIYKSGFIGKTLKINENRSLDDFTKIDIRKLNEIIIGKQNVRIISAHPDKSYKMVMKDKRTTSSIVILDNTNFWEYSKVLVVVYK